jgi:hypothetical protein
MNEVIPTPDFHSYTRGHWSCLLYIETVIVDHKGIPDYRKMNEDDRDAAEQMEGHGLLVWGGTGMHPVFQFTDYGWAVAHAIRRLRGDAGDPLSRPFVAAIAFENCVASQFKAA